MVSKRSSQRETPLVRLVLTRKNADLPRVSSQFISHLAADGEVLTGHYGQFVCGLPVDI